jgi:selenocysteine lyase/cysteine desulfurase
VRASTHVYSTEADVDALLAALRDVQRFFDVAPVRVAVGGTA